MIYYIIAAWLAASVLFGIGWAYLGWKYNRNMAVYLNERDDGLIPGEEVVKMLRNK